jgi:hypothetical protein
MASAVGDITFVVPGQPEAAPLARSATRGALKASVRLGTQRSGGEPVRVTARPGQDVVVLSIANGPTLVLHPADARDLMQAQSGATRSALAAPAGRGRGAAGPGEVEVPTQLGWPGLEAQGTRGNTRGWMGQALLSSFQVLTGVATDAAVKLVVAAATKKVDGKVEAGVYRLSADALEPLKGSGRKLDAVPAADDGGPMLVLVHGTFSDTVGTFAKLWTLHNATVRQLFSSYGDRVYGLDHPTLGASPIANALTLVRAMPPGARIHLVTHSRGGLVAEVLVRACSGALLASTVLEQFGGETYAEHRADLRVLVKEAQAKGLRIERIVRVGCPARGTLLASKRLDAYLSILNWCLELANIPVVPEVVDFLHEVARRRADPSELPGLEAMTPDSPVIAWVNSASEPIASELRVVAGDIEADSIGSWVKTLLSDAFLLTDNDPVVQTRSMYGGAARAKTASGSGARSQLGIRGGKVSHFSYFSNERTVRNRERPARRHAGRLAAIGLLHGGRRGRERHPRRARGRALARPGAGSGRAAGGVRHPGHPRLEPEERRQADLARLSLRQRPQVARLGSGDGAGNRARRADRQPLRRPDRASRRHPRGDRVRLRLAPTGRRRGAPPRRGGRCRACCARHQPAAGADPGALDGRPDRAHDGAREARHLAADDGARRRPLPDARHAQRRLMVADADALRR